MIFEICPKCGKKGLHSVDNWNALDRCVAHMTIGDKRCKYCGYKIRMIDTLQHDNIFNRG
jgi:hypothetical protein